MADLAARGLADELDLPNLSEYLDAMARRDRREVSNRLVVLLTHLLKPSDRAVIRRRRREPRELFESATLRNHAAHVFARLYDDARAQAADETVLSREAFPVEAPWDLDAVMNGD